MIGASMLDQVIEPREPAVPLALAFPPRAVVEDVAVDGDVVPGQVGAAAERRPTPVLEAVRVLTEVTPAAAAADAAVITRPVFCSGVAVSPPFFFARIPHLYHYWVIQHAPGSGMRTEGLRCWRGRAPAGSACSGGRPKYVRRCGLRVAVGKMVEVPVSTGQL